MLPILSPILIGSNHPIPHLVNKRLYAAALLESKKDHKAVGIVPLPESLPPFILLPNGKRYVRTENILLHWLPTLFGACTVKESCILCVTRNADISFDDEKFDDNEEDFRRQMKKLLKQRDRQIALGKDGYLCIKTNSVTEREVIDKLVETSQAGVEVQLIVRGICCILPGIPGIRKTFT